MPHFVAFVNSFVANSVEGFEVLRSRCSGTAAGWSLGLETVALGYLYTGLASAALYGLQAREAAAASKRALALGERLEDMALWASAAALQGDCLVRAGRLAEGLALQEKAWEAADSLNDPAACFLATWRRTWWSVVLGDPHEGQALCQRELAASRVASGSIQQRRLLYRLGQHTMDAGEAGEIEADLALSEGDLAFRAGDWERAESLYIAAAGTVYQQCRANTRWLERVAALLNSIEAQPNATPAYPGHLSEREVEVLSLLAQGKSNQAIADELVISLPTVVRHVSHVFSKIGAANRTEAAAYAHRKGLV